MCDLCSSDPVTVEKERLKLKAHADALEELAASYRALADKQIRPHMPAAELVGAQARRVIRFVTEDWL